MVATPDRRRTMNMSYPVDRVVSMPELTRAGLLDPQTPVDFLLLILIACSGPGALILVWLFFQDWRGRRKMARAARIPAVVASLPAPP